jgi:O-antigen ligase
MTLPFTSAPLSRGVTGRDAICVAGLLLLLFAAYFIAKNTSAKLMIAGLAIIVLSDPMLLRERLPRALAVGLAAIGGFAAWTALGLLVNRAAVGPAGEALASFALLALVLLAGRRLLTCCGLRFICGSLLAAAALSSALTLVLHFSAGLPLTERLMPLGRAGNPIPAAGGLCIALIAAAVLLREAPRPRSARLLAAVVCAILPILIVVAMTQSRGPIFAALVTFAAMFALPGRLVGNRLFAAALVAWALTTALIVLDPLLRSLLCVDELNFCRPSARLQIWRSVIELVTLQPVFGLTPIFRFDDPILVHAHNGLFGTAMLFGIPAMAAVLILVFAYCRHLDGIDRRLSFFCASALIFSFGYMGSDLPNPFSFANMHYFFLWLPIAFGLSWTPAKVADESP